MSLPPSLRRAYLPTTTTSPSLFSLPTTTTTTTLFPHPHPTHILLRPATLLRRPKRPYTFTQLVALSDGSTYTHRTTHPSPYYKSVKDARNTPLWNPSNEKVLSIEQDEAGKLRAFRERFGRGWDSEGRKGEEEGEGDNLMDLISGVGEEGEGGSKGVREGKERSGKGKEGER